MGVQPFEDAVEVEIALLEAEEPARDSLGGYPQARLRPTDRVERRTFQSYVLENRYLRATVIPALGGRVWSIFDKRSSVEVLPTPQVLMCEPRGPRGAELAAGAQLRLFTPSDRRNSLGPLRTRVDAVDEENSILRLGGLEPGTGLSFHLAFALQDEDAALQLEVRVFNRSIQPERYCPSFAVGIDSSWTRHLGPGVAAAYHPEAAFGIALLGEDVSMDLYRSLDGYLELGRFVEPTLLAPRQTDTWTARIAPLSGLATVDAVTSDFALSLGKELQLQASRGAGDSAKILLQTQAGDTLEAPVVQDPSRLIQIPLTGELASPAAVVVRGSSGADLLRWPSASEEPGTRLNLTPVDYTSERTMEEWRRLTYDPALRSVANLRLSIEAIGQERWPLAMNHLDNVLLFNADDPLAWWARAAVTRLAGKVEAESDGDLPNAHFLAPLDPMLRAESFLRQPIGAAREPSQLLSEFSPDDFVDGACLLIEHRMMADAVRLLDEGLRHRPQFMLHYLLAYCYLTGSRMAAEAAQHVEAAGRLPDEGPYPWRPVEAKVLARLGEDFGANQALQRRQEMLQAYGVRTDVGVA